jgi:cell division protein FtsL
MAMAQPKPQPRISNPRSARTATQNRIVKNTRVRYDGIIRIAGVLAVLLLGMMTYVMLLSNATSLTYALAKAQHQRDSLQEQTARLDDRIAQMSSEERLAAIAAKLDMHDPQSYALVRLPAQPLVASRFPVFDSIAAWLR